MGSTAWHDYEKLYQSRTFDMLTPILTKTRRKLASEGREIPTRGPRSTGPGTQRFAQQERCTEDIRNRLHEPWSKLHMRRSGSVRGILCDPYKILL